MFWHLTFSRSETNNAWKISLEVIKFVYLHTTFVLSVLIIGLNTTYTKFWILWICPRPTSYINTISSQNMTRPEWWNTSIAYERLCTFIRPVRHEDKATQKRYGYDTLQLGQVFSSSHFRHQAPPYMQTGREPSGERWNYFSRRPLSPSFSNCFWISEPVLFRTKYLVSVCSTYRLSLPCMRLDHNSCQVMKFVYMQTTCSVAIQSMGLKL